MMKRSIELRKRKAGKNGVVATLGMPEGQIVTVARVDERTELVSLEPEDRVREMVASLKRSRQGGRHALLAERLSGQLREGPFPPAQVSSPEADVATTPVEAELFGSRAENRRRF
jgi:hypothetical protein